MLQWLLLAKSYWLLVSQAKYLLHTGLHNNVQMFLFLWSLSVLIALKWPWHQQDNPYHMHITFPLLISKAKILIWLSSVTTLVIN